MSAPYHLIAPNTPDSHQANPGYVIAFLPFYHRNTYYKSDSFKDSEISEEALRVGKHIVVVSDAVHINISHSKGEPVSQAEVHLLSGDINYTAAVAPGDHAFIWLTSTDEQFKDISNRVLAARGALNSINSGLKFIGRVNSVRQVLNVSPRDGKKNYRYIITLAGFTELQTQIYFNEFLDPTTLGDDPQTRGFKFLAHISETYRNIFKSELNQKGRLPTETIINFLIDVFIGTGPIDTAQKISDKLIQTPNASFLIPKQVAHFLGLSYGEKSPKSVAYQYSDILQRVFGVQKYGNSMFPLANWARGSTYFKCGPLKGGILLGPANFNNITLWSLLTQYANPALNEMYTCLKYIPQKNGIYPTLVLRQIPFSTKYITKDISKDKVTLFTELPRWKLDPKYPILNYNLGTTDAERFNFFQVYTNSIASPDPQEALKLQIVNKNYRIDLADILRTGPRVHITTSDTEAGIQPDGTVKPAYINEWAGMIADFFANGHLKMNGTITVAGITDPICVGDNLEFDGKLFHIEGINHVFTVDPMRGSKSFLTSLVLSHGYYLSGKQVTYMHEQSIARGAQPDQELPGFTSEEIYVNDLHRMSTSAPSNSGEDGQKS